MIKYHINTHVIYNIKFKCILSLDVIDNTVVNIV